MKVSETMTRDVRIASPDQPLRTAAKTMADIDAGSLPVGENGRLVGMITDRDIVIRGVARGKGADATVGEVMTAEVNYCFEDEETSDVAQNMADLKIRRLPVLDRDKRLVGILSLGDIATRDGGTDDAGRALSAISEPGGEHSQA